MAVGGVAGAAASASQTKAIGSAAALNDLGKDAFLKLLIAELSNQDPLNPMEDREFISQMAQFSELEEMQNIRGTLENMGNAEKFSAVSYIGKGVAYYTTDKDENITPQTGIVTSVWFDPAKGTVLETTTGQVALKDVEGVFDPSEA